MSKNDLRKGASADAMFLMLIKLVSTGLNFVVTRLLSEYLSVYDYGTYSQILLVVSTVSSVTILGMMDGVNFFYCSEPDPAKRERYTATLFALQCVVGAVAGCAVLILSAPLCAYFRNPDVAKLLIFAAVLPVLQNLLSMFQVLLVSVGKARMLAFRNLMVSLLRLVAVAIVVTLARSAAVMLMTTLALDLAQIAFFALILKKSGCVIRLSRTDFRLLRRILHYCAPMAVFTVINSLNRDLDKYVIALWTDTETLAMYANASKVLPFDMLMSSFCTVLLPEITRLVTAKEYRRGAALYRSFLEIAYVTNVMLCGAALAAAPELMELLYSEKYLSGLNVFCVYILVDLVRFMSITLVLSAAGKTKTLMFLGIGTLGLNAVLNLVLFQWLGLAGPAIATLTVTVLMGVAMLRLSAKELQTNLRSLFDGKYLACFVTEAAILMGLFSWLRKLLEGTELHYFWILVMVAGGYCLTLLALNGKRLLRVLKQVNRPTEK